MEAYWPFRGDGAAPIAVELSREIQTVPEHVHQFVEFVLVMRGTCKCRFFDQEISLIPGDIFIVPAFKTHTYILSKPLTVYNVQFYPKRIADRWGDILSSRPDDACDDSIASQWEGIRDMLAVPHPDNRLSGVLPTSANLNRIGILRLNQEEASYMTGIMQEMEREQAARLPNYERILRAYLEILLVLMLRIRDRQFSVSEEFYSSKKTLVKDAILYMENHLSEPINFQEIAKNSYLSPNYFRTVFREATGLSPVDYLNRLRISKALEYIQNRNATISEAAAKVGIHDANYFSRLFKQIIGYPPSRFKQIGE